MTSEMSSEPLTSTLYVKGLPEKLGQDALRHQLYMIFSEHGRVLQIVNSKTNALRGQAWITFQSPHIAQVAMTAKQGFLLNGKPIVIVPAKNKSKATIEAEQLLAAGIKTSSTDSLKRKAEREESAAATTATEVGNHSNTTTINEENDEKLTVEKKSRYNEENSMTWMTQMTPSRYLLAKNLPSVMTIDTLTMLIGTMGGLIHTKIEMINGQRTGILEFVDSEIASLVLRTTNGVSLSENDVLQLSYGNPVQSNIIQE